MRKSTKSTVQKPDDNEIRIFNDVVQIVENRKRQLSAAVVAGGTLMFWEVGHYIRSAILAENRAEYGRQIVERLSVRLVAKYGQSFHKTGINRMLQFAALVDEQTIVATAWQQLSWSHVRELLPLKDKDAREYYVTEVASRNLGVRELKRLIDTRAYERREVANSMLSPQAIVPFNAFKDPYLLDMLGLKDSYSESDLEQAILHGLELFILEFDSGFTFVARQKRMQMNADDFYLDLLFYHRALKRLVAVELKLGKFKPAYKGQMEFYLKYLDKYERMPGENAPIGILLCAQSDRDQIELMELDKAGIAVAEYLTVLPPKAEFNAKIKSLYAEAQERLTRRRLLDAPQQ